MFMRYAVPRPFTPDFCGRYPARSQRPDGLPDPRGQTTADQMEAI